MIMRSPNSFTSCSASNTMAYMLSSFNSLKLLKFIIPCFHVSQNWAIIIAACVIMKPFYQYHMFEISLGFNCLYLELLGLVDKNICEFLCIYTYHHIHKFLSITNDELHKHSQWKKHAGRPDPNCIRMHLEATWLCFKCFNTNSFDQELITEEIKQNLFFILMGKFDETGSYICGTCLNAILHFSLPERLLFGVYGYAVGTLWVWQEPHGQLYGWVGGLVIVGPLH